MSYKSILVFLDNQAASEQRLDFAIRLADEHHAHLTGLHLSYGPLDSLIAFNEYGELTDTAAKWEETVKKAQQNSRRDFTDKAGQAGLTFDWVCYRGSELKHVLAYARTADISIVRHGSSNNEDGAIGNALFAQFAIDLGKPVLFLPDNITPPSKLSTVIVAWDGGRESTRAIADALPLLKTADIVHVITVAAKKDPEKIVPDVTIAAFLSRHGVKVQLEKSGNADTDVANWLLSKADQVNADLLVMGAYGHGRFSEFILGGVTQTIMQDMALPVLMSH